MAYDMLLIVHCLANFSVSKFYLHTISSLYVGGQTERWRGTEASGFPMTSTWHRIITWSISVEIIKEWMNTVIQILGSLDKSLQISGLIHVLLILSSMFICSVKDKEIIHRWTWTKSRLPQSVLYLSGLRLLILSAQWRPNGWFVYGISYIISYLLPKYYWLYFLNSFVEVYMTFIFY